MPAEAQSRPAGSPIPADQSLTVLGHQTRYRPAPVPTTDDDPGPSGSPGGPDQASVDQPSDVGLPNVGNVSVMVTMRVARFGIPPPVVAVWDASIDPSHPAFEVRLAADGSIQPASMPVIDRAVHALLSIRDIVIHVVPARDIQDVADRMRMLRAVGLACVSAGARPLDLLSDGRPVFAAGLPTEAGRRSVRTLSLTFGDRAHPAG